MCVCASVCLLKANGIDTTVNMAFLNSLASVDVEFRTREIIPQKTSARNRSHIHIEDSMAKEVQMEPAWWSGRERKTET